MLDTFTHGLNDSVDAVTIAASHAAAYLRGLPERKVTPSCESIQALSQLGGQIPDGPSAPSETIDLLHRIGSPATVATAGGRFHGLVVGGTLPAALGARVLAAAWDQVVFSEATSPIGIELESIAAKWILDVLGLPPECSVGFVTGSTMGTFVSLAAARHRLLSQAGWDVEGDGLTGAPPLHIVASEQSHSTVNKAVAMLGLGTNSIQYVPCDAQGRLDISKLPKLSSRSLVLTQAGNVNSGSFDPIGEIALAAKEESAWVHVDGAFGLWAAASPSRTHLLKGFEMADSWVTDGHKTLNTPYDNGVAICRHPNSVNAAMATSPPMANMGSSAAPADMTPEFSRSARGVEFWAALRSLGRSGCAALVDQCCDHAKTAARLLDTAGFEILNEVDFNQVVATIPGGEGQMVALATTVGESGEAWFGATQWNGLPAIRLSFSSWATTTDDVQRTVDAIVVAWGKLSVPRAQH